MDKNQDDKVIREIKAQGKMIDNLFEKKRKAESEDILMTMIKVLEEAFRSPVNARTAGEK